MPTGIRLAGPGTIVTAMNNALGPGPNGPAVPFNQIATPVFNAVAALLTNCQVPNPVLNLANGTNGSGQFDFTTWTLTAEFDNTTLPPAANRNAWIDLIAELGDTIAHESRHCEQWFRMARLVKTMLGERDLQVHAKTIENKLSIPNNIAQSAVLLADLAPGSAERIEAQEWYDSVYGRWGDQRNQRLGYLGHQLRPVGGGNATLQLAGQNARTRLFANYSRELPEEDDAWAFGHAVQTAFLGPFGRAPQALVGHVPVRQGVAQQ